MKIMMEINCVSVLSTGKELTQIKYFNVEKTVAHFQIKSSK